MPLLRRGDCGPAVAEIRAKLATLGLVTDSDGSYAAFDDTCDRAVRAFQQQRGLTVDGIVGPETYRALDEARWHLGDRVLSYAVSHPLVGDDVVALQQRLLDLGFDPGRPDGIFGPRTEQGVREFQRNVGLLPDGTCGPGTLRALAQLARAVVGGSPQAMRESEALRQAGPSLAGKLVVIDPGHGGGDRGVAVGALDEARLASDLARRVEGRLAATGVSVFLTRGPDGEADDEERAAFANTTAADLLISLHVDGHTNPQAQGVATYYFGSDRGAGSVVGARFASLLQREIVTRTGLLDCRTHAKTWDLLRLTRMPAIRAEVGYLTNPGDAARLATPAFRDRVAEAIVGAVQLLYLPPDVDTVGDRVRLPVLVG
ncbi:MAG: N-acetylmuramoyl-L-alanine amidase [Mycobacterium leprae]